MQFPAIHLNGTSAESLLEQYSAASMAVADAIRAVQQVEVNGRDYYTISSTAASVAMTEHRDRLRRLETVRAELEEIALYVSEQQAERAARKLARA